MTAPNLLSDLVPVNNTQTIGTLWSPFKEGYFNKIIVSSGAGTNYDYDGSGNHTSMDLEEEEIKGAPAPSPWMNPENFYISGGSPGYWNRTDAGNMPGGHLGIRSGRNSYIEKPDGTFAETNSAPGIGFYVSKLKKDHAAADGTATIKFYDYDQIMVMDNNSIRLNRSFIPYSNKSIDLGSSSYYFNNAYIANLKGNADSATKAANDSKDQPITKYIKDLSISGRDITYTRGDATKDIITTQDTTYAIASGDGDGQIKVTPSSGEPYNVSVTGLGSNAFSNTEYLPLEGGTVAGATIFSDTTASSDTKTGAVVISGGLGVGGHIYAAVVHNAVWNDLVDCMEVPEDTSLEYGYCYSWEGNNVIKSSRSSKNCIGIHSNTAGFAMGEKKTKTIRAAVAGFVLAYVDKLYPEGTPLTWGDDGVLTKCSSLKRILHPERVIATFYREEKEEKWHDLPVSGRHWVKIV